MVQSYLIVGGSSDIALVLGSKILDKGHSLTLLARDGERVQELVSRGAHLVQGDALDKECVQQAVELAKENGEGSLSGVAHLVGSLVLRPPHSLALDAFQDVIHTNLSSAFLTLVFTSSGAASLGLMNHEAIAAAKGGVESMVRSAAATYSQRKIRVNAVAPGLTDTRLAETLLRSDAIREAAINKIPIKRINEKEEIASTMEWLLCSAPDNLTGQILHLDGGMAKISG